MQPPVTIWSSHPFPPHDLGEGVASGNTICLPPLKGLPVDRSPPKREGGWASAGERHQDLALLGDECSFVGEKWFMTIQYLAQVGCSDSQKQIVHLKSHWANC